MTRRRLITASIVLVLLLIGTGAYALAAGSGPSQQDRLQAECSQLAAQARSWARSYVADLPHTVDPAPLAKAQLDVLETQHRITGCPGP